MGRCLLSVPKSGECSVFCLKFLYATVAAVSVTVVRFQGPSEKSYSLTAKCCCPAGQLGWVCVNRDGKAQRKAIKGFGGRQKLERDCSSLKDEECDRERLVEAVNWLDQWGIGTDFVRYATLVRWCGNAVAVSCGKQVHSHVIQSGEEGNTYLGNLLVHMYGRCGTLEDARAVFDKIRRRNLFSWNIMVAAYAQNGNYREALDLFREMQLMGVKPDKFTFIPILSACAVVGTLAVGRVIHARIVASGCDSDLDVENALINTYGKCGSLKDALAIFDKMYERDVVSWTAMIAAYTQSGEGKDALGLFRSMVLEGVRPNKVTLLTVLDACACLADLAKGREMHERIVACGYDMDVAMETALVNMYSKCGSLEDARLVFDRMHQRDVVSWSAIIAAYAQSGHGREALKLYQQMDVEGVNPNRITFLSVVDACASIASLTKGRAIHERIVAGGFERDVAMSNALISMYGKCGSLKHARAVFDRIHRQDVVSWTAMIAAYAQNGRSREALELFRQMDLEGVEPNKITFLSIVDACVRLASLAKARTVHEQIVASGFESDVTLGNALVNLYGKCGSLKDAQRIFDKMHQRDVVSWNALILASAQNGHGKDAIELFHQMKLEGVRPNDLTFLGMLHACNHAGLLDEGRHYFMSMRLDHGITPMLEHYSCMIDLLGRVGLLDEANHLMCSMLIEPDAVTWMSLLSASRVHGDVERGTCAAEHVFELDPKNAAPYILLSNIYAAAGRWDAVTRLRRAMGDREIKKQPGCSWIEVEDRVHRFIAGDSSHPLSEEIYAELLKLGRQMEKSGYIPDTQSVLHDVEEEEKGHMLFYHSEKLAIAFGLITTLPKTSLFIVKNLRVCSDCHAAIKFISNISDREVIVRDSNCFHHFNNGVCSCGDYW